MLLITFDTPIYCDLIEHSPKLFPMGFIVFPDAYRFGELLQSHKL